MQTTVNTLEAAPYRSSAGQALLLCVKLAIFLGIAVFLSEAIWRGLGYQPAGSDIRNFARLHNSAMQDPSAVALVGSSRVRCGLRPDVFARQYPGLRFVQLGILGNSGMPVLEDLANDEGFRGRVICEFNPNHLLLGNAPFASGPEAMAFAHPEWRGAYVELVLGEFFREHFSFYSYNMVTEFPRILQHKAIPPPERPDRFVPYRELGLASDNMQMSLWLAGVRKDGEQLARFGPGNIAEYAPRWVNKIRRRGGDVIFVRMPVDRELRTAEEQAYPQTGAVAARLRAAGLELIEYTDFSTHFRCPDGSHLSADESVRFTGMLAQAPAMARFLARR